LGAVDVGRFQLLAVAMVNLESIHGTFAYFHWCRSTCRSR